jgi:probable phosphoglycerate mutase
MPGVPLSPAGLAEAERLATRLQEDELAAVYSSPLERAVTTASHVARGAGLRVELCDGLIEIDFGEWTGKTFDELARDPAWHRFNACRGSAQVPGGESALHVQARIVAVLDAMRTKHPGAAVALVTHADVIRAAVLHCAGAPLDLFDRFEISPASVTAIEIGEDSPRLLYVNERDAVPHGRALPRASGGAPGARAQLESADGGRGREDRTIGVRALQGK